MDLEGIDTRLYNVEKDPQEMNDLSAVADAADTLEELSTLAEGLWDKESMAEKIQTSQKQRLAIHAITGGDHPWVYEVRHDDANRYVRNAGAADTKAKARFPRFKEPQPDL